MEIHTAFLFPFQWTSEFCMASRCRRIKYFTPYSSPKRTVFTVLSVYSDHTLSQWISHRRAQDIILHFIARLITAKWFHASVHKKKNFSPPEVLDKWTWWYLCRHNPESRRFSPCKLKQKSEIQENKCSDS